METETVEYTVIYELQYVGQNEQGDERFMVVVGATNLTVHGNQGEIDAIQLEQDMLNHWVGQCDVVPETASVVRFCWSDLRGDEIPRA